MMITMIMIIVTRTFCYKGTGKIEKDVNKLIPREENDMTVIVATLSSNPITVE